MKSFFLGLILFGAIIHVKSQKRNLTDSLKAFATSLIKKAQEKETFDKIAIAKFTTLNGGQTEFGSYISMRFGIYVEEEGKVSVIDIDNLQSILKEKNVDIKSLLDQKTVVELRKHNIDAVVVGRIGEIDRSSEFELLVRVMSIKGTVSSLASAQAYFQKDSRMIAVADELPLNKKNPIVSSTTVLSESPSEIDLPDYPLNSLCARMNLGDVSFTNSKNRDVLIKIYTTENTGFQRNQLYNNGTSGSNQSNQTYGNGWGNDNGGWNYGANNSGWGNVTNNTFRPTTSTWQGDLLVGIVDAIKIRKQPRATIISTSVLRTIIVKANSSETVTDLSAGIYEYGIYSAKPGGRDNLLIGSGRFQVKKCVDNPVTVE
jgi:hypothetical protein